MEIEVISTSAAIFSAVCAAVAASLYWHSVSQQKISEDVRQRESIRDMHKQFQAEMRHIQWNLPNEVNDTRWRPDADHRRTIQMYWYLVFDEWFLTTQIYPKARYLWEDHYKKGVAGAINIPVFRDELHDMISGSRAFLGMSVPFGQEINSIYNTVNGKDLNIF